MKTILLVENNRLVCDALCIFLETAGCSVIKANDGRQGLELAGNHAGQIHLVITEVFVPAVLGPEIVWKLKQTRPSLRALFLTKNGGPGGSGPGEAAKDGPFWLKSVCTPAFLAIVRELLDESDEAAGRSRCA